MLASCFGGRRQLAGAAVHHIAMPPCRLKSLAVDIDGTTYVTGDIAIVRNETEGPDAYLVRLSSRERA
jgi:hypothetical protein